jgi:uncharacterized RDD family membrane protein YckC
MSSSENPYAPSQGPAMFDRDMSEGELATLSERFSGAFIDGIINLVTIVPLALGAGFIIGATMGDTPTTQLIAQVLGGLLGLVGFLAIQGYFLATRSQTIGKIAMKTKIVSDSGQPQTFSELYLKRYFVIQLLAILPYIGGLLALVDILLIFRSSRKCLHDDIAGTKVIKLHS